LLQSATMLEIPVLISEQYPKGLGSTVPDIVSAAPSAQIFAKMTFSCARDPALTEAVKVLRTGNRNQIIICGIEAHVCVAQTALDLVASGAEVFVVADAVASRRPSDMHAALERFRSAGISIVTSEMVVFEWLEKAGTDEFKAVSGLLKPL
ncbi:MAG: isochorismatase family protein, partial [Hyphomicrobiales bacterium]